MKKSLISYCIALLCANLTIQGHAQSSGAPLEAPVSPTSLPAELKYESEPTAVSSNLANSSSATAPPANSSEAPFAENKFELSVSASDEHESSTPKVEITSENVKIIMEGFDTSNDTDIETADATVTDTVKWNVTTVSTADIIQESDLSLSFISSSSHISSAVSYIPTAGAAAIVAGILCTIGITAYGGVAIWRRVLQKRYGNRELLVNEEFYDVNGLKYFEL